VLAVIGAKTNKGFTNISTGGAIRRRFFLCRAFFFCVPRIIDGLEVEALHPAASRGDSLTAQV
jgi:hypothetical protein